MSAQELSDACWAAIPAGKTFNILISDPCWSYKISGKGVQGNCPYKCLTLAELSLLPVQRLAQPNSVMLMWTTGPKIGDSIALMKAWGFEFKTVIIVWNKTFANGEPVCGLGRTSRSSCEFVMYGTRGRGHSLWVKNHAVRQLQSTVRGLHSVKPESIKKILCDMFQPPDRKCIELFARQVPDISYECDSSGLELVSPTGAKYYHAWEGDALPADPVPAGV